MARSTQWKKFVTFMGASGGVVGVYLLFRSKPVAASVVSSNPSTSYSKWDFDWDKREPNSLVKPPSKKTPIAENEYNEKLEQQKSVANRHLFLIRHGQYILNGATDKDRLLTPLGAEQADLTGRRLKELAFPYTQVIRSTLQRATQTANIICKHIPDIPVSDCDLLREGAPVVPEPPVHHWKPERHQFFEDGARIEAAFRKHFHRADPSQLEDSYEVLVCHANVIRYFVCRALQFPPEAWLRMSLHHGSITWLVIRPSGRVILKTLGDAGYMPKTKMSTS